MSHELEHEATNASLPAGMALAYDGLRLERLVPGAWQAQFDVARTLPRHPCNNRKTLR